ncbi:probable basic-leucine zipper transcription factor C [Protopterus annectens]|uniref:probable basic-leucine zipper transcription factor C n=1 Tax=Protopterus annectens TaxID=7888 RepID=UPI001CFA7850|nr:probable basic-leucine zipper transcription factor C [Protopterus annectens]
MAKLLVTKKKKIIRDVQDYAANKAYPHPPFNSNSFNFTSDNFAVPSELNGDDESIPVPSTDNINNEEIQPVRRSERLNNTNNNNNNNNNNTNFGHQGSNSNNNQSGPNRSSDFQMNQGGRNNSRRENKNQGQTQNKWNQWRR